MRSCLCRRRRRLRRRLPVRLGLSPQQRRPAHGRLLRRRSGTTATGGSAAFVAECNPAAARLQGRRHDRRFGRQKGPHELGKQQSGRKALHAQDQASLPPQGRGGSLLTRGHQAPPPPCRISVSFVLSGGFVPLSFHSRPMGPGVWSVSSFDAFSQLFDRAECAPRNAPAVDGVTSYSLETHSSRWSSRALCAQSIVPSRAAGLGQRAWGSVEGVRAPAARGAYAVGSKKDHHASELPGVRPAAAGWRCASGVPHRTACVRDRQQACTSDPIELRAAHLPDPMCR